MSIGSISWDADLHALGFGMCVELAVCWIGSVGDGLVVLECVCPSLVVLGCLPDGPLGVLVSSFRLTGVDLFWMSEVSDGRCGFCFGAVGFSSGRDTT